MEKKTKYPAELLGEVGLQVPKPLGKGMLRVWRGRIEEQRLALAVESLYLLEWREQRGWE